MDVRTQNARWLDLAADLVTLPSATLPHDRLLTELSATFESLASWHFQDVDGSFRFDLSQPVPGLAGADLDVWSRANRSTHPLLFWFQATLDPRPMTIERVPRRLVPEGGFALVRELCSPYGLERQLSIPYEIGPSGSRAFVLAQSGEDYSADDVRLARLIQPLIALISRQTAILARVHTDHDDPVGLTGREHAVLQLLSEGLTAQGIGHALVISPRTVHTHLAHVYAKLGVSDRLRAVAVAEQLGLVRRSTSAAAAEARPSQVVYEAPIDRGSWVVTGG
jgi:DNA-binding CsgD family transcriptional regulator